MARQASDPSARLALLRAALDKARTELKGKKRIVNADEMAAIAGQTWRNLKPQVEADPAWPVERRGSEGIAWQFDAIKVLKHMIGALQAKAAQRDERSATIARMAGVEVESVPRGLEVRDLVAIDQLQTSVQRRKIEQRAYIKREDVETTITGLFTLFQTETLATVSRLDPAGRWPATVRAEVADELRSLLVRAHDRVGRWLIPDGAGVGTGPAAEPRRRARPPRK